MHKIAQDDLSLLGINLGTTGCKAGVINAEGRLLGLAYREYETLHPQPGWAGFDSRAVWGRVKEVIAVVARMLFYFEQFNYVQWRVRE